MMTMPVASPAAYRVGLAQPDIRATTGTRAVGRRQTDFDGE
jgi:hypothetical protein